MAFFIPAHVVLRVQVHGDTLAAIGFDYDWFLHDSEQGRLTKLRPTLESRQIVEFITVEFRKGGVVPSRTGPTGHRLCSRTSRNSSSAHIPRMAENTKAGELRPREKLCDNSMSCAQFLNPAIEISGGFHAAAPASAR